MDLNCSFVIEDVTVIDGTDRPPTPHRDLIVRRGRIETLCPSGSTRDQSLRVIDGRRRFVIPGMWETQAHLTRFANGVMDDIARRWPEDGDVEILESNARSYLRNGFTSVVDLGGPTEVLRDLRERLRSGRSIGARLFYVGRQFVAPGGLPRIDGRPVDSLLVEVQTPDEAVAAVEAMSALGIDAVKINHTPGFELFGTGWPLLGVPTLTALIGRAHTLRLPVIVHIDDPESAAEVLDLGVDGIEHTFEASRESLPVEVERIIGLCRDRGAYWGLTVAYLEAWARAGDPTLLDQLNVVGNVLPRVLHQLTHDPRSLWTGLEDSLRAYFRNRFDEAMSQLRPIHDAGIRMTISTDSGNPCTFHGLTSRREMELMVQAGVPAHEVLQSATRHAADKFRQGHELGTIEPGKRADLVLLARDPLRDIRNVASVEQVFQDGRAHLPRELAI